MRSILCFSLIFVVNALPAFSQQKGYYRTPALFQNTVVFTAEGDLWKHDLSSGFTLRLTTNAGMETNPVISPDGKQLVFCGEYEGSTELYLMNINGSVPKRLTYDYDDYSMRICGWTKDGKILYRTGKYAQLPSPQLVKLDPVTLVSEPVPLWQASLGVYDDAGMLFFTRFPNQGSYTKRYKGGFIEQVWKFDGKQEAINLTGDFDGTSTSPMVYQDRIYFLSDRDGTMNLWSMNKDGKGVKQQTFSKGWDLQSPGIFQSNIVYQKGADIWLYDIAANKEKMLDISLQSDFDQRKPKWIKSPATSISYSDISPNGNYVAIISRGRLFVSPARSDRWVEVTRRSGIRYKQVHFMNDKSVAVLSDESGEFEIWKMNADGSDSARQITKKTTTLITDFVLSPNEKSIAYTDKNNVLRIADVSNGDIKFSYDSSAAGVVEMSWSPDSRFLNITRILSNSNAQICVVDTKNMSIIPLTTSRLDSYSPSWSADSNWIYFVSDRNLQTKTKSPWGQRQPEPIYTETGNIYAMSLDTAGKFPFLLTDSWLTDSTFTPADKPTVVLGKSRKNTKEKPAAVTNKNIDWAQAKQALYQLPLKSGNIAGMAVANGYLYWINRPDANEPDGKLMAIKMEESKKFEPVEVASGVLGFKLSANRKKLLINYSNKSIVVADANGAKPDMDKNKLQLNNWSFAIKPTEDWKEMFADAWRMMRDYFYDRDMHKVDWQAVRKQYEPLLERVTDRYELDDLLAQMVGELSALHTFVYGGDKRVSSDKIAAGFLGANLVNTPEGALIQHIYASDPDYPDKSSPLHKTELRIKEGDIITAVNNVPLSEVQNIAELLAGKAEMPVKLSLLNSSGKAYQQLVTPISDLENFNLHYEEWELGCRAKVDSLGKNDVGYVHLKAMGANNMDEFVKQFYPVFNRKALIIDVRHNFGGNIDSWVLEKLMRKAWMYWQGRAGEPYWNMPYAFRGEMVILCDQVTSSDGEAIAEGFRRLGLGKVIGMRTWGGEIWLTQSNRLVDDGVATAAEFGVYGPEGQWLIEGHGVVPDITVDNLPFETYKGKDAQLEYAVDYLSKKIKADPRAIPKAPPHPDKSFKYDK